MGILHSTETQEKMEEPTFAPNELQPLWNIDVVMNNILQYVDWHDLLNCLVCNRTFYELIMNREFLVDRITCSFPAVPTSFIEKHDIPLTEITNWMKLNNPLHLSCQQLSIVHMGDRYWKWFNDPVYGIVARLYDVCWVQIEATRVLKRGTYNAIWMMRKYTERPSINKWRMFVRVEEDQVAEISFTNRDLSKFAVNAWFDVNVGQFEVTEKQSQVSIYIHNFEGDWKSGIDIAKFRFERVK